MKIIKQIKILVLALGFLSISSCELEGGESLNGTSTNSISDDLSRGELPQAMAGVLFDMKVGLATQYDVQSIFGREYYFITGSDPRFQSDVVTGSLDNNTFYTTRPWGSRYSTIKDINLILTGLANTTADFSASEIAAIRGVLNTFKAHELLMLANNYGENGIRLDTVDPDNLGPFVSYDDALTAIVEILNTASLDLISSNGQPLLDLFSLSSGYASLTADDTPANIAEFIEFNRAITARVEAYRGNYSEVITLLNDSFMDMGASMDKGVYHTFSLNGADIPNPLFLGLNQQAIVRIAHPSFIDDALPRDTRVNKVVLREEAFSRDDLSGAYDVFINQSNEDNISIIRNEELILLAAEANITINPVASVIAIDRVRTAAGLRPYTGAQTPEALQDEILFQRRYSLFGESHRWIDMRRFRKIGDLPNDRAGDAVPMAVPIPFNENK